jgi:hypothetical protein
LLFVHHFLVPERLVSFALLMTAAGDAVAAASGTFFFLASLLFLFGVLASVPHRLIAICMFATKWLGRARPSLVIVAMDG